MKIKLCFVFRTEGAYGIIPKYFNRRKVAMELKAFFGDEYEVTFDHWDKLDDPNYADYIVAPAYLKDAIKSSIPIIPVSVWLFTKGDYPKIKEIISEHIRVAS